ncbi:endonuclease III [uncultured Anaerococcus sp.]|uniref:endonuclease III n=1 Tax=uncultured Anaerococcus sp. TaxID=293428 RepID=UPI00288A34BF|nr:endonuclease III [uncultured Anaerococcus sp.]
MKVGDIILSKKQIGEVLEFFDIMYPDVDHSMLNFTTPFELLVATILSAQATDVSVNKVTGEMFKVANTPEDFANMDIKELENHIRTIGIYRNKAKNIKAMSKILIEDYNSVVPADKKELQKLPGVGRKTANVVCANAFGIPSIAVDTHVFRVSNRIGLADATNVDKTQDQLEKNIDELRWSKTHHQLISHGRALCKARNPLCEECMINKLCLYYRRSGD